MLALLRTLCGPAADSRVSAPRPTVPGMAPHAVDWSRWRSVRGGWVLVSPDACPRGHRWAQNGPRRPRQGWAACTCSPARGHTLWTCPGCEAMSAAGCRDVTQWVAHGIPAGSTLADRGTC